MILNYDAVQIHRRSHGWKIIYEDGRNYWFDSAGPCNADPNTINSFRNDIGGMLDGVLLMKSLLQYHDT